MPGGSKERSGWLVELLAEFGREPVPKFGMGFDEAGDVAEIFKALALPAAGIAPSRDLAGQGVFQGGDAHQDAVNVGRDGTAWKFAVEFFGAEPDADLRPAGEVDRPFVGFGLESGVGEKGFGPFDVRRGDDQIDVARDHGFLGPMVDGHAADGAPGDLGALQGFDEAQNVACAARRLPVVELPSSHVGNIADWNGAVNHFLGAGGRGRGAKCEGRQEQGARGGGRERAIRVHPWLVLRISMSEVRNFGSEGPICVKLRSFAWFFRLFGGLRRVKTAKSGSQRAWEGKKRGF